MKDEKVSRGLWERLFARTGSTAKTSKGDEWPMSERILEDLTTHNERMKRESEAREEAAKDQAVRRRRMKASERPTGLACPLCQAELGDVGAVIGGFIVGAFNPHEAQTHRLLLCPKCDFEGWRVIYQPREHLQPTNAVDPVGGSDHEPTPREAL